ncbi:MAG: mannose-6-phosphate isomerase [Firmicutes bacterium]|nr:mannose-6-phosphate isomerase [Bacillota bacterium]
MKFYPLKLRPVYNERPWGGGLEQTFPGKGGQGIGESWELSLYPGNQSTVANGSMAGQPLAQLVAEYPQQLLGDNWWPLQQKFPLLIKLIGAREDLSVQVHPDDQFAAEHEQSLGKAEMWYIVSAKPGSRLIMGVKPGVDKAAFSAALERGELESVLNQVPVHPGDAFYIPPGTVHAIGAGIVLAEVQQSSDVTYRVYDWNRTDSSGNPRELHVDKALSVLDIESGPPQILPAAPVTDGVYRLIATPWFSVEKLVVAEKLHFSREQNRFETLVVLDGLLNIAAGEIYLDLEPGDTVFIPACVKDYRLRGRGVALKTYI